MAKGCFVAGTEVITGYNAQMGVFSETVGEQVEAINQDDPNGPMELETVTAIESHVAYDLRDVPIQGSDGSTETIQATDEHPFYVENQGWTGAEDLTVGEQLQEPDGSWATVVSNVDDPQANGVTVYNFTVANDHTYFVDQGGTPVWVHNVCAGFHHMFTVALGNQIPYGDAALTWLNEADHTAVQTALNKFLKNETTLLPSGELVDMFPRNGNPGTAVIDNFTLAERTDALTRFYTSFNGGQYLPNFQSELASAISRGLLLP